jgi:ATP synthase protein I
MDDRKPNKMDEEVGKREKRKLKARGRERRVWFGLGMFGLIGWAVAVPTILGVMLGVWLDRAWPAHFSWTLALLAVGVILGCVNAWYWVKREMQEE